MMVRQGRFGRCAGPSPAWSCTATIFQLVHPLVLGMFAQNRHSIHDPAEDEDEDDNYGEDDDVFRVLGVLPMHEVPVKGDQGKT